MNVAEWLAENYSEISPIGFYRDLFPVGELDAKDAMTKGQYCAIAVQIGENRAKRLTITDDLDTIQKVTNEDLFTVISPVSYAGKAQKKTNARNLYAITVDVDSLCVRENGRPIGIETLIRQIENEVLPRPTYIVATGDRNIHLYYMLETAIPLFRNVLEQLTLFRQELTLNIWNRYITDLYNAVQQEPPTQSYRAVGTVRKDGKGRVRAFLTGDKVTIEYLNQFVSDENRIKRFAYKSDIANPSSKSDKEFKTGRYYIVNQGFYYWMLEQIKEKAKIGRRYFCICTLVIAGVKTNTPLEQVRQDAYNLIPLLDRNSPPDNRFTKKDVNNALSFYKDSYRYTRKKTLERMSGIQMPTHKRNGRTKEQHMKYLNGMNAVRRSIGEDLGAGRPSKKELVFTYLNEHPKASVRTIAKELGINQSTAQKWAKIWHSEQGKCEI